MDCFYIKSRFWRNLSHLNHVTYLTMALLTNGHTFLLIFLTNDLKQYIAKSDPKEERVHDFFHQNTIETVILKGTKQLVSFRVT